jgi:hypothetical protein
MTSRTRRILWCTAICLLLTIPGRLQLARAQDKPSHPAATNAALSSAPSGTEIAAAKASGKVWVNLDSGIYHKGGRWYGKTKNGKFMTTEEAKKSGFKLSKRE